MSNHWDRLIGELVGVVFVISLCWLLNQYPNGIVYCKVSNVEVIKYLLMSMAISQRV